MRDRPYLLLSAGIFGLVALMHVLRVILAVPVSIGETVVPPAASWLGLVAAGALAVWGFRLARR
ncbi:MAG TPA: hypothetical protein VJS92_05680 [Candidatus Polarisedimenticolaceae bacterium]|nr:hypothetical protein [Candidatus Polarisedimenticolaceae bacterium]